jgi:hypothetical protein
VLPEHTSQVERLVRTLEPLIAQVAAAKVEVAYGRRTLGDDRIRLLRDAYRRLRVGLLRLVFRRLDLRRGRRR